MPAHLSEGVQGGAVSDDGVHVGTKRSPLHANEFRRVLGTFALRHHALGHPVGVAQEAPNGVVHGRDLSGDLHAQCAPTSTTSGQGPRLVEGGMKAARPHLTSVTKRSAFCEFFDTIEAVMSLI